jgi:hypothetical protein
LSLGRRAYSITSVARSYRRGMARPSAVAVCGVHIAGHHQMVARARAAIKRLDARLAQAKADGALRLINSEYRRRRTWRRSRAAKASCPTVRPRCG